MKTTIEQNYKKLLSLGFKRLNIEDKDEPTSGWMQKRIDINEFKGILYYDGRFALMEIDVFLDPSDKKKSSEIIWVGSFKQLLLKAKKYG